MATAIQFLRSSIASLRPTPPSLSDGMPMVNFNGSDPGLYFKLSDQTLMKVGPTQIGEFPPNYNATGYDQLCRGEMWLDTSVAADKPRPVLKLWNGTDWVAGGGSVTSSELPQSKGTVLAGPVADPDQVPTFRALEDSDLPDSISPDRLGGKDDGALLIGGSVNGFAESQITLGDDSLKKTVGENVLTLEVTAGNIAGKGSDGTIKTGDGHIQLNYDGLYSADNRFKFIKDTGTLVSLGPTELGQNAFVDTHTIIGATTISGDVELTNVYGLTVGGDLLVGHNVQLGSDTSELLTVYNKSEFYSDVFIKDSKALDVDGNLEARGNVVLGETNTQLLTVNATTSILAPTAIGRNCGDTLTVEAVSTFGCDVTISGDLVTNGEVDFGGDVTLGSECSDFVAILGTQLNKCDVLVGTNLPDPNSDLLKLEAATGDVISKGAGRFTTGLIVSDPLTDANFAVVGSTGDVNSKGSISCDGKFIGDGSELFNLAVPNSMLFSGDIDATTATPPAGAQPGDFWLNTVTGNVEASWPDIGGAAIQQDQFIYYAQTGPTTFKWNLGSVQNSQGFVTINSAQNINGSKTFTAPAQFGDNVTVAGTITVTGATQLNDTLTVAANKATALGGTLSVADATTLGNTLTVSDAATFNSTLEVTAGATLNNSLVVAGSSTLNSTLVVTDKLTTLFAVKDCANQALLVNGSSVFECSATFNGGIDLGPGSDMNLGGNFVVEGNTTLGTNCVASTLTVNAVTGINCATTITGTLTVSGNNSTSLGGALDVTGAAALSSTLAVTGAGTFDSTLGVTGNTSLGGTLTVTGNTTLNGTLGVATGQATALGGTLTVTDATTLSSTLTVAASQATSLGGTLQVLEATTLLSSVDCTATALTVNGLSVFNCLATFNEGISIPSDKDLAVGGDLTVNGDTSLGTACGDDTLTITAVTTISCATTIANTLTVSGDNATTLGGSLSVTGATTLSSTLAVTGNVAVNTDKFTVDASNGNTVVAGTLAVTGKVTAASTASTDGGTTVVTLDYLTSTGGGGTGGFGYWSRTGTTLSTKNSGDAVSLGGTLTVTGATTLSSTLAVTSNTTVGGTLGVTGATTCSSTLDVTTNATVGGTLGVTGATTCSSTLTVTSNATVGGTFGVTGATTLSSTVAITGVTTVSANIVPASDGGANLGSSSARFANLYTQDMHFSNEGTKGNDVDGTTGDWTLQEGNDHIYFINNKTGAKFRVVMESVG